MASAQNFNEKHVIQYGLRISSRDATGRVESVSCQFCVNFGREKKAGAKRNVTTTNKMWSYGSFRVDNFADHLKDQHPVKYAEYNLLDRTEKLKFFECKTQTSSLQRYFSNNSIQYTITSSIVDVILREILVDSDPDAEKALQCFKFNESSMQYVLEIKNKKRFDMAWKFLAAGSSFRQLERYMKIVTEETGISYYSGVSDTSASVYSRIVCGISLEYLSQILSSVWAFALALDSSTHLGHSYLDMRARFIIDKKIQNVHLIALPLHGKHTAQNMFLTVSKFLDTLVLDWRKKLIGVSTDGARVMTGRIKGLVTLLESASQGFIVRVWCGLHQLDLEVRDVLEMSMDGTFLSTLTYLIAYLRRQYSFIEEVGSECPKYSNVRWLSMGNVSKWLLTHRMQIQNYMDSKMLQSKPDTIWWVFLYFVNDIFESINGTFKKLQGNKTTVAEQKISFAKLRETIDKTCGVADLNNEDTSNFAEEIVEGNLKVDRYDVAEYLENLSRFTLEEIDKMSLDDTKRLTNYAAKFIMRLSKGIKEIEPQRNSENEPYYDIFPTTPNDLSKIKLREFVEFSKNFDHRVTDKMREEIDTEFSKFKKECENDEITKNLIETECENFDVDWAPFVGRFPNLIDFVGGIAAVFPNTATVESDFSDIGNEKTIFQKNMTDFTLEGLLQCIQFDKISNLIKFIQ